MINEVSCALINFSSFWGLLCSSINQRKVLAVCRIISLTHLWWRDPWWIFRVFWASLSTFKIGLSRSIIHLPLYNTMWHVCLGSQICSSWKFLLKSVRTCSLYRVSAEGKTFTHMHINTYMLRKCSDSTFTDLIFMHSLRDQSNNIRREVLFEIQELGRVQEEMSAIQQNVLSLLTVLQSESAAEQLQVGALWPVFYFIYFFTGRVCFCSVCCWYCINCVVSHCRKSKWIWCHKRLDCRTS